ncbi:MAG TPA: hypothetical protein VGQ57_12065 [Polyangiaceae bacterium]|nr:hypothetical protein [Polyangiaceae bacterium]
MSGVPGRGARTSVLHRRVHGVLLVLCLASAPRVAAANGDEPAPQAARRVVRLEVLGTPEDCEALRGALSELLSRIGVELESTSSAGASGGLGETPEVVAAVDLRASEEATVRLARGGAPLGPPRSVARRDSREVLLEETALVVYSGSESLLEPPASPPPLPSNPEPPAPVAPPSPPLEPKSFVRAPEADRPVPAAPSERAGAPWVVEGTALVSANWLASDSGAVTGFGLGARGHVGASRWLPAAWLHGKFQLPFRTSQRGVELSTSVWSVRLEAMVELLRAGAFRLETGAGGGVDVFVATPVSSVPGAELGTDRHDVSPVLSLLLAGSVATSRASRLLLAATLDDDLDPHRYVVAQGGERHAILEPLRLRPALSVGFCFEMAGAGRRE